MSSANVNTRSEGANVLIENRLYDPNVPSRHRLRFREPQYESLAREMVTDIKDPTIRDPEMENLLSTRVWGAFQTPAEPSDPLGFAATIKARVAQADPATLAIEEIQQEWRRARAEGWTQNGGPDDHAFMKTMQRRLESATLQFVAEQRVISTEPFTTQEVHFMPAQQPLQLCQTIAKELRAGWRFPGGLHPAEQPDGMGSAKVLQQLCNEMDGFRRDLFDNGHTFAGCYPLGSYAVEKDEEGVEVRAVIGGQVFEIYGSEVEKEEERWKFVKRSEVDWEKVAADGGLGDLVVFEEEEDEDEAQSWKDKVGENAARRVR